MKKKIFLVISAMFVLGLAIVVYSAATASADLSTGTAACCCCHGDSCPMKAKAADGKEAASSCDDCECCNGDGESCPMMKKDADGTLVKAAHAKDCPMMKKDAEATAVTKVGDAKSCPMMKRDTASTAASTDVKNDVKPIPADAKGVGHDTKSMHGEGGCCPCCNHEKEKIAVPAG